MVQSINIRPSPELIKARKREIARRYARKAKHAHIPVTFAAIRVSELTRLFAHRYSGLELPDSDDGVQMVRIMAHHLGRLRDAPRRISQWCMRYAPWLDLQSVEILVNEATEHPLKWKADKAAWKLRVTAAERDACRLRTIGAIDQTKEQRAQVAKQRKRERDQERRRAQGAKPRAQYEITATATTKPWVAQGISRRTWYRRRLAQVRAPHIYHI